jgi:hypothetical protein
MQAQLLRPHRGMPSSHKAKFSIVMRLNVGVASPATYLGGVQDLLNIRLVNKDMSTCCRKSVLTDMIGRNWRRMLHDISSGPIPNVYVPGYPNAGMGLRIVPEELSNLLKLHGCIVAGPFAFQCVTGETCGGGSDRGEMHIYCTTSGFHELKALFLHHNYVCEERHDYERQCLLLWMGRIGHEIVLIRMCDKHSPRDALALFKGEPGVMTLHEGSNVNYWFRDNDAKSRIVLCNTVAPLCYALIK